LVITEQLDDSLGIVADIYSLFPNVFSFSFSFLFFFFSSKHFYYEGSSI